MSLLLVSDTHMHFEILERMVAVEGPSAVLHAGDLGLFDAGSWDRTSARERRLIVKHQDPLDTAVAWTEGRLRIPVPLVAVPGNHEDFAVVADVESGRRSVPGLRLVRAGDRIPVPLGERALSVMGLGRILPDDRDPSPLSAANQIRPEHVAALEAAWTGEPPDIFLLHEPPRALDGPRGAFGSDVITRIVALFEPHLVVVGHMHFPYLSRLGPSTVVGLGYGVKGHYALLDEDLRVHHRELSGRPVALTPVTFAEG